MDLQLGLFEEGAAPELSTAPVDSSLAATARRLPNSLRLGTSSWSFPGWEGIVYDRAVDQRVLAREGLSAYAHHPLLRTVGLDRTYYRSIGVEAFRAYADAVPKDFRFLVKADRLLTSPTDPGPRSVRGPNPLFLDSAYARDEVVGPMTEGLGAKAGPLLFQFSPIPANLVGGSGPFVERLHAFLEALPKGPSYAVELRTPAFLTEEYAEALRDVGASHCYTVHPAMSPLDVQFSRLPPYQQPTLVVRWMLHAGLRYEVAKDRYEPFDRIVDEDSESREAIAIAALDAIIAEVDVFVIVNNKAEGSAPLSVFRLAERIAGWTPDPSDPTREPQDAP
jgi:uncharacterized protein YecE (DUF72 family)